MQGWEGYPPTLMSKQRITGFRRKRLLYSKTFLALVSFPKKNPKPKKQKKKKGRPSWTGRYSKKQPDRQQDRERQTEKKQVKEAGQRDTGRKQAAGSRTEVVKEALRWKDRKRKRKDRKKDGG